jgi:hypothetical protein
MRTLVRYSRAAPVGTPADSMLTAVICSDRFRHPDIST